jgi:hypothetical protein
MCFSFVPAITRLKHPDGTPLALQNAVMSLMRSSVGAVAVYARTMDAFLLGCSVDTRAPS